MKQDACRAQCAIQGCNCGKDDCPKNGLQEPLCSERGMAAWVALQFNHLNPEGKQIKMSGYNEQHPEQMLAEHEKPHEWICGVCHAQDANSTTSRVATEVHEERKEGETDEKWRLRVCHEKITAPKHKFVLELKLARGRCEYPECGREVTADNATGFDWDHVVQSEKRKCRCKNRRLASELLRQTASLVLSAESRGWRIA